MYLGRVDHWRTAFDGRVKYLAALEDSLVDGHSQVRRHFINQKQGGIRVYRAVQYNQEAIQALFQGIEIRGVNRAYQPNKKHA